MACAPILSIILCIFDHVNGGNDLFTPFSLIDEKESLKNSIYKVSCNCIWGLKE